MKVETAFYKWIVNNAKEQYFCRIEHATTSGIPDLFTIINNKICFIELKISNQIRLENPRLNKYQIAWHMKHNRAGGNAFILVNRHKQSTLELFTFGRGAVGFSHIITQPKTSDGLKEIFNAIKNTK